MLMCSCVNEGSCMQLCLCWICSPSYRLIGVRAGGRVFEPSRIWAETEAKVSSFLKFSLPSSSGCCIISLPVGYVCGASLSSLGKQHLNLIHTALQCAVHLGSGLCMVACAWWPLQQGCSWSVHPTYIAFLIHVDGAHACVLAWHA